MVKGNLKKWVMIAGGTLIMAVAVYFFMLPSNVAIGSATALAQLLGNFIPLPVSAITMILNVILLILGYIFIGRDFAGKTVIGSILLPIYLSIFEILFPDFQSITQDPVLDMVCYILVVSIGLALMFSCNASTGGLEVVAKLMNKYLHMDMGQAFSLSGILVALSSAVCYDKKIVVISVLGTYFGGLLVDHFSFGLNLKRRVCIISDKYDEIVAYILHDLRSGASLYDVTGAYDNKVRREINIIVDKQEYRALMDYMQKTDPKAFITVYAVNEVSYQPKK